MASCAHRHLFLLAFVAMLAVATPSAGAWSGARLFFSKTTRRPQDAVEPEKAAVDAAIALRPDAADPNSATVFSRPSTGGRGRGYGLYGRPEENFPPDYFRRGVHRNAEKLTTTTTNVPSTASAADEAVPVGGRGERAEPLLAEDNGSGRGRPPWTNTNNVPTTSTEETAPMGMGGSRGRERAEPFVEGDGSGRGRAAPWYYGADAAAGRPEEQRNDYGMSDTRLYQNGRYYYDVNAGRYGYDRESNLVRTRPEEFGGSGAGDRRRRYGNTAAGYQYGNGDEFGNGMVNGFQEEEGQAGRYIP